MEIAMVEIARIITVDVACNFKKTVLVSAQLPLWKAIPEMTSMGSVVSSVILIALIFAMELKYWTNHFQRNFAASPLNLIVARFAMDQRGWMILPQLHSVVFLQKWTACIFVMVPLLQIV